jgi:pyruvate carboxylase subunit B
VQEGGKTRTFTVTLEPVDGAGAPSAGPNDTSATGGAGGNGGVNGGNTTTAAPAAAAGTMIYSTFAGSVEIVDILVKVGDRVNEGSVIAQVEAMKAKHDIRTPKAGTVTAVHVAVGREIDSSTPIVTVA